MPEPLVNVRPPHPRHETDQPGEIRSAIAEVVERRYRRLVNEHAPFPDLVIIDGGKGQLSATRGVFAALGIDIPVIAIAKREEEIYVPDEVLPHRLDPKGIALHYVQEIRNEAHRFAVTYNRLLRKKSVIGEESRKKRPAP